MSLTNCPTCGETWTTHGTACKQARLGSFAAPTGLADVLSYIKDQSKQFRQCASHHAEHNRGAEAVAIRASEILDRIAADIKSANVALCDGSGQ